MEPALQLLAVICERENVAPPHIFEEAHMGKGRLEAFSDGVIAIIITIMRKTKTRRKAL